MLKIDYSGIVPSQHQMCCGLGHRFDTDSGQPRIDPSLTLIYDNYQPFNDGVNQGLTLSLYGCKDSDGEWEVEAVAVVVVGEIIDITDMLLHETRDKSYDTFMARASQWLYDHKYEIKKQKEEV